MGKELIGEIKWARVDEGNLVIDVLAIKPSPMYPASVLAAAVDAGMFLGAPVHLGMPDPSQPDALAPQCGQVVAAWKEDEGVAVTLRLSGLVIGSDCLVAGIQLADQNWLVEKIHKVHGVNLVPRRPS